MRRALSAIVVVSLFLLSALSRGAQAPQKAPQYEVYAIRYATLPGFPLAALVKGADPARKLDIAMIVWLLKGNGRTILVDSGFYRPQFLKQWTVKDFMKPSDAVAQA
ncbi:MAG TPA: hypothetical protein VFI72_02415, partial [Candidatus Angelobacter sp.]|nr:hypothetical protein [Candidatus Angelobacter sp.]